MTNAQPDDILTHDGPRRTDLHCHDCDKNFIARLDHSVMGNHVIECPYCGHEHCRVITKGEVTGDRWDSRYGKVEVSNRSIWKHDSIPAVTSSASAFMRDLWLNRSDG